MFWYTYLFLNFLSVLAGLLTLFSSSTVNLLLLIVIITFFQGLNLLLLGANMLSLYLIIIYLGAIVILFSFMVLFINWEEEIKRFRTKIKVILLFMAILLSHIPLILTLDLNSYIFNYQKLCNFKEEILNNTTDSIGYVSNILYGTYLITLLTMVLILSLGLLLVIRLVLNKNTKEYV
uniref:NADH dehydrogenase subunit 6 n=1 Tax=Diphyes dispar TaxID=316177 RepID=UPI0026E44ECB|nr:NADH dehydrogenase subunit 6 [Diphyes dispar]WJJ69884.1 NADH dehydrogenase subunit 6 [Diphyes dispar]